MDPRASFRLFRTGLIGSVVLGLAAGGHLAGGGQLPALSVLAALCAVTMVPVAALTRFRLSLPVLTGLIGAVQLWLHWTFGMLSVGPPAAVHQVMPAGHAGHAATTLVHETLTAAVPAHTAAPDALMIAAHAVATVATALLLARGERALGFLAGWLRPLLGQPEPAAIVPARVPGPSAGPAILRPAGAALRLPSRRGPPAAAPAA
ncbi:hypothetical protein ABFP37_12975 [Burkholderia sp. RS01]|uniref:hypothetical protein n=1 Tax=unclassified Burkholderia TaxID=2613784 RepID=UPI00321842F8